MVGRFCSSAIPQIQIRTCSLTSEIEAFSHHQHHRPFSSPDDIGNANIHAVNAGESGLARIGSSIEEGPVRD
jgi:hypothetical protein